ncbi:unnamed protein product [Psylliodes chrysocephalus]|uniref:BPTI/Kunitz inhibitor domain-containing protein n=1 Tax=Psylliodes chrysocephalus TaxID=3402493 RepID=A0A9P0CZW2_9CUCU|nr:unnamed protein product [Psylliodes chrysocephala]
MDSNELVIKSSKRDGRRTIRSPRRSVQRNQGFGRKSLSSAVDGVSAHRDGVFKETKALVNCWKDKENDSSETEKDCKEISVIYRWNVWENKCQRTVFGACKPSRNVFYSLEACEEVAKLNVINQADKATLCRFGEEEDKNNPLHVSV